MSKQTAKPTDAPQDTATSPTGGASASDAYTGPPPGSMLSTPGPTPERYEKIYLPPGTHFQSWAILPLGTTVGNTNTPASLITIQNNGGYVDRAGLVLPAGVAVPPGITVPNLTGLSPLQGTILPPVTTPSSGAASASEAPLTGGAAPTSTGAGAGGSGAAGGAGAGGSGATGGAGAGGVAQSR